MEGRQPRINDDTRPSAAENTVSLLRELVAHLRQRRTELRQEWARRIRDARLLTAMSTEEIFSEATAVYDNYVEVLETGSVEALQAYARDLSERIIPRGVETNEVVGIVLLLRDVLARSLFEKYHHDFDLLNRVLDAYEPAANSIANTVGVSFVEQRERVIRQQQKAIRELSTPVLQVRERLLILPIIGVIEAQRARQLTEQLLRGIRANRAKVVVVDVTGVPAIDSAVANHLVQTVEASRLMGAIVIITGLSSEIAQTLVTLGVDLSKMNAVGDLQGGIEEAERLLANPVGRRRAVSEQPLRFFDASLQVTDRGHFAQVDADGDERLRDFRRQAGHDDGGAQQARGFDRLDQVVRDAGVHGRHTGHVDHDDFGAVGANGAQQLLRQLAGALRVDDTDDRQNQEPLAHLEHGRRQLPDGFLLLPDDALALFHESDGHRVRDAVCRGLVAVQDPVQFFDVVLVFGEQGAGEHVTEEEHDTDDFVCFDSSGNDSLRQSP